MSALTKCHMQADCNYANCQYASCNFASCHYANSDYADCHCANCHNYANCKYVNCQYADCQYVDWQYADCHYANSGQLSYTIFWAGVTALRRRWLSHPDPANRMSFAEVQYKLRQHHNTIIVNSNFFIYCSGKSAWEVITSGPDFMATTAPRPPQMTTTAANSDVNGTVENGRRLPPPPSPLRRPRIDVVFEPVVKV